MVFLSGAIFLGAIASAQGLDATDFGGMAQSGEASLGRSYWACRWSENEIFDILRCGNVANPIVNPQISRFIDVYRVYTTECSDSLWLDMETALCGLPRTPKLGDTVRYPSKLNSKIPCKILQPLVICYSLLLNMYHIYIYISYSKWWFSSSQTVSLPDSEGINLHESSWIPGYLPGGSAGEVGGAGGWAAGTCGRVADGGWTLQIVYECLWLFPRLVDLFDLIMKSI